MSDVVIAVEDLSKYYRLGQIGGATLQEDVHRWWAGLRGRPDPLSQVDAPHNHSTRGVDLWALRNVSFRVRSGEILGIVGRNGAGKSTLLKILSRITAPTTGRVKIKGRVGSLLEVGTGFHPELTGRENIFLNGAILGMNRAAIDRTMDAIVDFSGVGQFIDTPVKRYSSGMYVRLAFAVAAHLDPEILVVDEVLAVGDAQFQKKCIGKLGEIAQRGRTVLFVSHNIPAIMNLCSRCIVLDRGTVSIEASVERAIEKYLCGLETSATVPLRDRTDRKGNGVLRLTSFGLRTGDGSQVNRAQAGQTIVLEIGYASRNLESQRNVHVAIGVHGGQDENLFQLTTTVCGGDFPVVHGDGTFHCRIHSMPLQPGRYPINLFCTVNGAISDWIEHAAVLDVEEGDFFSSGRLPAADQGPLLVAHEWNCVESSSGSGVTTPLGQ